ncbi:MAG: restriction endonuclease subunit S [Candidatus Doudnabacteria bacterium]
MKTRNKQQNIPNGWVKKQLREVVDFFNGKGHEKDIDENGNYVVVNSKFISSNGKIKKYSNKFLVPLKKGDIAMVMSDVPNGKAIAKCFYVNKDNTYTLNQRIGGFRAKGVSRKFLYLALSRNRYFLSFDDGVNQTNLRKDDILSCPMKFPPLLEQNRIATVLETWDEAIEKLKKKIALKKNIKKGLMQQLLTGKKRLPGFSDEWKEVKLKDIAICLDAKRVPLNSDERSRMQGIIPYCGANNIVDYVNDYLFDEDIILVAEDGGQFDEYQNRPIAYRVYGKSWVNNHAHVIKANEKNSQDFLFYSTVHKNVLMYLNGGTRAKLNKSELLSIKYSVPELREQKAIADILTSADDEIAALQKKLTLWQEQKKYLLNNLVTGKIRTPEDLLEKVK